MHERKERTFGWLVRGNHVEDKKQRTEEQSQLDTRGPDKMYNVDVNGRIRRREGQPNIRWEREKTGQGKVERGTELVQRTSKEDVV